jgi:hypothetical protein
LLIFRTIRGQRGNQLMQHRSNHGNSTQVTSREVD